MQWKQKGAQAKYQLDVKARRREGDVSGAFGFEIVKTKAAGKVGKLKVRSSREDIVKRNKAQYESTFALARYEFKVYDSDGEVAAAGSVDDANVPPGGTFEVTWPATEVFMIWVRGEDEFGRFTEYKLVPWAVEIPHTEINFDSGKWDIKNDEAPKLDDAVAVAFHELIALEKVNDAVNANLSPQLYIVGYTDTVGNAGSNQKLSNSRAKQIAQYFYEKGFWAEIFYAGMGERGLRVETDDNVDEVRNRRALYLIGVQKPAGGGQIPSSWKRLAGPRAKPMGFTPPPLPEEWKNYREERKAAAGSGGGDVPGEDTDIGDKPRRRPVRLGERRRRRRRRRRHRLQQRLRRRSRRRPAARRGRAGRVQEGLQRGRAQRRSRWRLGGWSCSRYVAGGGDRLFIPAPPGRLIGSRRGPGRGPSLAARASVPLPRTAPLVVGRGFRSACGGLSGWWLRWGGG